MSTFDNATFWNRRYRTDPERGSGIGSRGELAKAKRRLIQRAVDDLNPTTILDVGCGDLASIMDLRFGGSYIGVDIAQTVLDANELRMEDARFVVGDFAAAIPPGVVPADLVLCFDVLIHQHDRHEYTRLARNVISTTLRAALISGYESAPDPEFTGDIVAFHEPLSETLGRLGITRAVPVLDYRGLAVVLVEAPDNPAIDEHPGPRHG